MFVGVGIQAFYPQPEHPRYPEILERPKLEGTETPSEIEASRKYQAAERSYQQRTEIYNRNVFIVSLVFAVMFLAISLTLAERLLVIADGLLLGGVFTLAYAVGRGFMADDRFRFAAVSSGLVVALILGYLRFIRPLEKKASGVT